MIAKRLNCSSTASPISACSDQERQRLRHAHLPCRDRPRPRPLDPGIEIAVGDVVPGAARAAHHEGADEEQHDDERQLARRRARCRRRAPPTTSTASAAARIRSAGRNGRAADRAATRTARAYRPSCRWHRQRGPWRRSSEPGHRVRTLPFSVSKVLPPFLHGCRFRKRRRRAQHFAEARAGRSRRCRCCRDGADLLLHRLGVLVAGLELIGDLRRNSAFRRIGFDIFDHLDARPGRNFRSACRPRPAALAARSRP